MSFSYWVNEVADIPIQREDGTWYDAETGFDYSDWTNQAAKEPKPKYVPSDNVKAHRSYAKQFGGKALTGTEKQKNWAEKIRAEKLAQVSDNLATKILVVIAPAHTSKFWIENRDKPAQQMADYAGRYLSAVRALNRIAALIEQVHVNDKTRYIVRNKPLYDLHRKYNALLDSSFADFDKFDSAVLGTLEQEMKQANQDFADAATVLDKPKPAPPKPFSMQDQIAEKIKALLLELDKNDDPIEQLGASLKLLEAIQERDIHQNHDPRVARFIVRLSQERIPEIEAKVGDGDLLDSAQALLSDLKAITKSNSSAQIQLLDGRYSRLIGSINAIKGFDSIGDIPERDAWKFFPRMALYHETDQLAHKAATSPHNDLPEPTLEQKISGDYAKGHLVIAGMPIAIENPQWSVRSGTDADGTDWSVTMQTHYGYFKGTKGADGDEVDVILMPRTEPDFSGDVYVIAQNNPKTGEFDEHKVVLGAVDADQAIEAYHANYSDDWQGFGSVKAMSMGDFQDWLQGAPDRMMFDGIGGDIRLVTEQDIQADPLAVLDLCVGVLEGAAIPNIGALPLNESIGSIIEAAQTYAKSNFANKSVTVKSSGESIILAWQGIKHALSNGAGLIDALSATCLQQLVENSSYSHILKNKHENKPDILATHLYTSSLFYDEKKIPIGIVVREYKDGRRMYDHFELKNPASTSGGTSSSEGLPDQPIAGSVDRIAQLSEKTTGITPTGRTNPVKTAKGTKIGTQFAVVEVEKLITSHDSAGNENPAFPQELQPRDRSRDASRAWVAKTANSLDNDSLGRTSRADSGAPIVGRDGIVESGNGRTMAIRMAYDQGTADEYRQFLIDEADYFGIDPDQVEGMERPVLVRVRTTDIDRRVFTVEANQDDKLALSATERARSDAKRLDANMLALFSPDENGSLLTASNHKFLQAFLASLGDAEAAQYRTSGGKPTRALVDRIRAAVFSKAYNDDRLLEMMADDANPDLQNVLNALGAASSKFIEAQAFGRAAVEDTATSMIDGIEQSLDERVTNAVIEATNTLLSARANNQDVAEYVRQQGLFEDIDDGVAALAVFLAQNSRSAKRMAIAFKAMAEYVKDDAISQANNGLFGEPVPPSLIDVVAAANIELTRQYGDDSKNIGLFDSYLADGRYDHIHLDDLQMHPYANAAKERQPTAKTPLLVQKNRRGDLYLIAGVKRYEMALDDDVEYLPAVILPVIEGYGDPVIKRVLNAYTGSIDPLALMAAIEDAVIERADKKVMFGSDQLVEKLRARRSGERAMFDASDTTAPQSSADIKTLEDAKNYWNTYFLSRKRLVQVRHNNRQYDLKIDFLTDHAYTKKNPNGNDPERVLDLSRAQALDNIWKVLNAPDAITWSETTPTNKQYDSELSVVDKLYGRVILRPKPTAQDKANNECTHFVLVSWHLPSESQHKKALVRTYGERTTPISLPKKQRA